MRSGQPNVFFLSASYVAAGYLFWLATRSLASFLEPSISLFPPYASMAVKVAIEELLRILITVLSLLFLMRFGWSKKYMLFTIMASVAFAMLENTSYLLAYPSSDIYFRAGYSSLIHANNAAIMALAAMHPFRKKTAAIAGWVLSLALCVSLHFIFNTAAASIHGDSFALPGLIVNCVILLTIFLRSEKILFHKEEIDERT